eukprot:1186540-Prorocentrum_minimum.AAC.2
MVVLVLLGVGPLPATAVLLLRLSGVADPAVAISEGCRSDRSDCLAVSLRPARSTAAAGFTRTLPSPSFVSFLAPGSLYLSLSLSLSLSPPPALRGPPSVPVSCRSLLFSLGGVEAEGVPRGE